MTTTTPTIHGTCDPAFERVRETLAVNFERRGEVGASVAVTRDGEFVVDLWGGAAGPGEAPWQRDTIVNVYSTTKTMAAICVLMLIDRGTIDPDAPVATYWPEFAANGKEGVLVRHVMSHSAGLADFDPRFASPDELYDWDMMTQRLAAQAPRWEPGTASGYHSITQGYLQGELVRRVTGRTLGTFFREEVAEPLGADFHIGLAPEHDDRVGELIPPPADAGGDNTGRGVLTGLEPRTADWRRAEIPAAGGIGNARAVARVHAALACGGSVDGVRLMSEATVESILREQTNGVDRVLGMPVRFGMGFGLKVPERPISPNDRVFFWGGWGGSLALIDLDERMSFAYVMNRMSDGTMGDTRSAALIKATYSALEA